MKGAEHSPIALPVVADLVVLAATSPVLGPLRPALPYLSWLWQGRPIAPAGDVLGAAAAALGVALWLGYLGLALRGHGDRRGPALRLALVMGLGLLLFVLPAISDLLARGQGGLEGVGLAATRAHDGGVLQTQAAAEFLRAGINPYAVDYHRTDMARSLHSRPELWAAMGFPHNPALDFYPYPPLTFVLAAVAGALGRLLGLGADPRVGHLLALAALATVCVRAPRSAHLRPPLLALVALWPVAAAPFAEGYNDVLALTATVAALVAAHRGRFGLAFATLALACGLKQFAWLLLPLYLAYRLSARRAAGEGADTEAAPLWRELGPGLAILASTFAPFALWSPTDLWRGLITGQGVLYPVRATGLGLSNLWIAAGVVGAPRDPTPHLQLYALVVLPALALAARGLWRDPAPWRVAASGAVVLGLFMFVSRFFAPSYAWWLVALAAVAAWLALESPRAPEA